MISSEQAFDMLPYVSGIYEKLELKEYIEKNKITINADNDFQSLMLGMGLDMFSHVLKNTPKVKKEVFTIVSIVSGKKLEEVKAQSLGETIKVFREIFEDKEMLGFFKQATT